MALIQADTPSSNFFLDGNFSPVAEERDADNMEVIGTIPETTANEGILIKVNQRAYEYLKAVDKRFRVELSYFQ